MQNEAVVTPLPTPVSNHTRDVKPANDITKIRQSRIGIMNCRRRWPV